MNHCFSYYLIFTLICIANYIQGAYEWGAKIQGPFESIIVTSTNLVIRFNNRGYLVSQDDPVWVRRTKGTSKFVDNNEALILTPDRTTSIGEQHASVHFTPLAFKNQLKGFRVVNSFNAFSFRRGQTNDVRYVVLSDTPVEVGEEDVDMVMVLVEDDGLYRREWKPAKEVPPKAYITAEEYRRETREARSSTAKSQAVANPESPTSITDISSEVASGIAAGDTPPTDDTAPPPPPITVTGDEAAERRFPSWLPLGAGALLCLGAALYVMRKKKSALRQKSS